MEVKVKPLVWREANDGNYRKGECFTTRSPISFAPIAAHKKHDGWWLNVDCKTYPTLEAAKAAAQADYDEQVRSAIIQPTLADALELPEIKALVETAEYLKIDMIQRAEAGIDVISGEQYRVVNAGNGAWIGFCEALSALQEKGGAA